MAEPLPTRCCSFCGKPEAEVKHLVAAAAASICDECVSLCCDIFAAQFDVDGNEGGRRRFEGAGPASRSLARIAQTCSAVATRLQKEAKTKGLAKEARTLARAVAKLARLGARV